MHYELPGYNRTKRKRAELEPKKTICGFICHAGADTLVLIDDHSTKTTILIDRIKKVSLADDSCCCRDSCESSCAHGHSLAWTDDFEWESSCCESSSGDFHESSCTHTHSLDHDFCHAPICNPAIPLCDCMVQLRLAGLNDRLNFRLFLLSGCKVIIELND